MMTTASSPHSANDNYSPPCSPTRSYLPSQAAHTDSAQPSSSRPRSSIPMLSENTKTISMTSAERCDFPSTATQGQLSAPGSQSGSSAKEELDKMTKERSQESDYALEQDLETHHNNPVERPDPMRNLSPKDWVELEGRYDREMEAAIQHEQFVMEEIDWVLRMMKESTIASSKTESERAEKRLRTRVAYVQQSEEALAEKRVRYNGVVDAFRSAMALLGGI